MDAVAQTYRQRADLLKTELGQLDKVGGRLANARVATFLLFAAPTIALIFNKLPSIAWVGVVVSFVAFLAFGTWHSRIIDAEKRAKARLLLNERGLLRLAGQWRQFAGRGDKFLSGDHLYAADLDVFGQGSLFQRLDETGTAAAETLLASWLAVPAGVDEIKARQAAIRELAPKVDFRQALVTEARVASEAKADPSKFIGWVEAPSPLAKLKWVRPFSVLPVITIVLGLLAERNIVPVIVPAATFILQALVAAIAWKAGADFYEAIADGEAGFVRFERTFAAIEKETVSDPLLARLKSGLDSQGPSVAERLRRFSRWYAFAELRSSGQYHALINVLLLWDIHFLFQLESWRANLGTNVRRWFESLTQLEALSALSTYAYENPDAAYPEVDDAPAHLTATAMGHPLLDRPIRNDVAFEGPGHAYVITGSNMSGKTTLLRAIGLNAVMALAGLPVSASKMNLSRLNVLTSMRVKDSLERGVSYFYAEVQRIKAVLDSAQAHRNGSLFLLDELLMGTNAKERQHASRELVTLLLKSGAIGGITTHDLGLTALQSGSVRNVHFRDLVNQAEMSFDYQLREGVVETTNALALLRAAGVPIP